MKNLVATAIVAGALAFNARPVSAQWAVFDAANHVENSLNHVELKIAHAQLIAANSNLVKQITQAIATYNEIVRQYNLALQMSKAVENMPARYKAAFSELQHLQAISTFGTTGPWDACANTGIAVPGCYDQAADRILQYSAQFLNSMTPDELERAQKRYDTLDLQDGGNQVGLATIGLVRAHAPLVSQQIAHLEADSFSGNPDLNTEVAVLNKINAATLLLLESQQEEKQLLVSLLEEQTIGSKINRDLAADSINGQIVQHQVMNQSLQQITEGMGQALQNYRMP